jgi:hypothetical protein
MTEVIVEYGTTADGFSAARIGVIAYIAVPIRRRLLARIRMVPQPPDRAMVKGGRPRFRVSDPRFSRDASRPIDAR